jgi:hypothetical protein
VWRLDLHNATGGNSVTLHQAVVLVEKILDYLVRSRGDKTEICGPKS